MTDNALVPLTELERYATAIAKSGLFGIRTTDQAIALMAIAQAEGRHPALAAADYDIISGRPAKKSQAMLRDFLAGGGKVEWHESTDAKADATFTHPQGGKVRIDWDMERAGKAGVVGKDNWKKYPRAMLRARVISEGVRAIYPAATGGLYEPGEIIDITEPERTPSAAEMSRSRDGHSSEPASRAAVDAGKCEHIWANAEDGLYAACQKCGIVSQESMVTTTTRRP